MEGAVRAAVAVVTLGTAFRLAVAAWLPLGLDEAYALAVARDFPLAFYDHPPLGFWAGAAIPALTGIEAFWAYRLPHVALGTLTGIALWRLGVLVGGPVAGLWAVTLHALAPHLVIGSGIFVLPDAPLHAALAWLAVLLVRMAARDRPPGIAAWAGAGLLVALALASKVQAGLVLLSVLLWLATGPRRGWLATPGPWVGAAVGLAGLLPTLIWNAQNGWPQFTFHAARTGQAADPLNLAAMTAGQIGYLLPPTAVLATLGLVRAFRRGAATGERVLAWLALVPIAVFAVVYLFGTYTFPHWPLTGWIMALPLAGAWAAAAGPRAARRARAWVAGFAAPVWTLAILAAIHLPTGLLTRGMDPPPAWDDTVEAFDWRALPPALAADGWLDGVALLAAPGWIEAGLVATAFANRYPMRVPGPLPAQHHFAFLPAAAATGPTLMLSPGRLQDGAARLAGARAVAEAAGAVVDRAEIVALPRAGRPHAAVAALRLRWPVTPP